MLLKKRGIGPSSANFNQNVINISRKVQSRVHTPKKHQMFSANGALNL